MLNRISQKELVNKVDNSGTAIIAEQLLDNLVSGKDSEEIEEMREVLHLLFIDYFLHSEGESQDLRDSIYMAYTSLYDFLQSLSLYTKAKRTLK